MSIPALGTPRSDYFYGDIPCTRELTKEEVNTAYELNTGKVIIENLNINPMTIPGIVVKNHGTVCMGQESCRGCVSRSCEGKGRRDGFEDVGSESEC